MDENLNLLMDHRQVHANGKREKSKNAKRTNDANCPDVNSKRLKVSHSKENIPPVLSTTQQKLCGKIRKVHLVNFMCHSNFEFNFGDKINFISGKNGSGKSAILTALVIGLGGRTADTNRGKSFNQLIKSGQHKSTIEISMSNEGLQGFEQSKYGNDITVIRNITENGSSSYKLRLATGSLVPLKSSDLKMLLLRFNIQVSNPLCILNQDTSRTFLKTATPKELYSLFKKATLIELVSEQISQLRNERIPQLKDLTERKKQAATDGSRDILEYQKKLELFMEFQKLLAEERNLQNCLYWSYVKELEEQFQEVQAQFEENKRVIQHHKDNLDKAESQREILTTKNERLTNEIERLKEDCEAKEVESTGFQQKLLYHKSLLNKKNNELNTLSKQIANNRKNCERISEEIKNKSKRTEEINEQMVRIKEKITELNTRKVELKAVKQTTDVHKQQLQDTLNETCSKVDNLKQTMSNLERNINSKMNYLQHLKSTNNKYSVFANWMPQLIQQIESVYKKNKFIKKPVGPLGLYIKVKDKTWGPSIESFLSTMFLQSFCVDNSKDYQTLSAIIKNLNIPNKQMPTLFITKFFDQVHDIRRTETKHNMYSNLLHTLEISNSVVANLVIDQYQADTILLIPTNKEALPLMSNGKSVPHNCNMVLTKMGDMIYPYPNFSAYAGKVAPTARYLHNSTSDTIRVTTVEVETLSKDLNKYKVDIQELYQKQKEQKKNLDTALKESDKINRQIVTCEEKIIDLQENEMPVSYNANVLLDDLEHRTKVNEQLELNFEKINQEKAQLNKQCEEMEGTRQELEEIQKKFFLEIKSKEDKIKENKVELKKYNLSQDNYLEVIKKQEMRAQSFKDKLKKIDEELKKANEAAMTACPERVISESSKVDLELQLKKVMARIAAMEKRVGPKPKEPQSHRERLAQFEEDLKQAVEYKDFCNHLERLSNLVMDRLHQLKQYIASSTRQAFKTIIRMRKFVGTLNVDHEEETLAIQLRSDPNSQTETVITTLSGGERSFSMVAFIMALWNNMESPFFFMDEFDVFMDEVNRKLIMELLMTHARSRPEKQFVFLTPHATYEKNVTDIQFFRMDDPREKH
ncbi:structural maintenance of chromosomes protein 6 [Cimex lectularius]|uniref:Rad50/SbcC-type AAA domain-containing protein n=1 Tax=Cimex lectularius TaxID=79782 RepID=A0A8I6RIM8_CIMLE|nr:structural maintenance of chromosomes protein 6 [Cimex lectularius]XP_024086328.1 structural maintenance of chromosomes protein 6 [Cimex lectularius]